MGIPVQSFAGPSTVALLPSGTNTVSFHDSEVV